MVLECRVEDKITCHAWNADRTMVAVCPNSNVVNIYRVPASADDPWERVATLEARFADTPKRRTETELGAVVTPGFGTKGDARARIGSNDDANAANTAVMLAPARAGLSVAEYAPNMIKKTVVGAGHADKSQIAFMVKRLLPQAGDVTADAADALAVAITHAQMRRAPGLAA
jgi:hypothetical protein